LQRALITGIAGFAGSHLADYLLSRGDLALHGIVLPNHPMPNLAHCRDRLSLHSADMAQYTSVLEAVATARPDLVFHLAARASVAGAWQDPQTTLVDNTIIQLNLLRAIIELGLAPRILIVCSADEYGHVAPEELPITEDTPLRPGNPYAVSKITQDYLGYQYHLSHGLDLVRVRPFNHIGPRQNPGFVVPDFAAQIARIEAGQQEPVVRVGNLAARRDFTDVRDMVRAYWLALERGRSGAVYNVGSSQSHAVREVLELLLAEARVPICVDHDPERMRPSDTPEIVSDCTRFREETGWEPTFSFPASILDVLQDWRQRTHAE